MRPRQPMRNAQKSNHMFQRIFCVTFDWVDQNEQADDFQSSVLQYRGGSRTKRPLWPAHTP